MLFYLTSCNNSLNVVIIEELEDNVVLDHISKDSLFESFYKEVRLLVDSVYTKNHVNKIINIKYSDLYSLNQLYNKERKKLKNEQSYTEFITLYKNDFEQFKKDSIKFYNYKIENDFSRYVKIDPIRVFERKDWLGLEKPILEINITPLNDVHIRKIGGYISIVDKNFHNKEHYFNYTNGAFFSNNTLIVKDKIVEAQEYTSTDKVLNDFVGIPISIIKQKHDIRVDVFELIINDRYVDVKMDSIPYSMKNYLENKSDFFYKYEYIRSEINKDFKSYDEFVNNKIFNSLSNAEKELVNFFDFGYSQLYKVDK